MLDSECAHFVNHERKWLSRTAGKENLVAVVLVAVISYSLVVPITIVVNVSLIGSLSFPDSFSTSASPDPTRQNAAGTHSLQSRIH